MPIPIDYKPINIAKNETRLLEIETGHSIDDPIRSRLVNVKITNDVEFIGLSALWGNPDETEAIWINGTRVSLPANIGQALRNVRAVFRREPESLYPTTSHGGNEGSGSGSGSGSRQSSRSSVSKRPGGGGGGRQPPSWLRHLLRGVRSVMPEGNAPGGSGAGGGGGGGPGSREERAPRRPPPLRVWLDCVCVDGRSPKEEGERRAHLAMVYGSARLVVGWLGPKDETSDMAIGILRTLNELCPRDFGEPGHRTAHPEDYGPRMDWMRPIADRWEESFQVVARPEDSPMFRASVNFLGRPFFNRLWILQEVALSNYPAFLLGDEVVSWMQMLRWNRLNEEVRDHGCVHLPKPVMDIIVNLVDIGTVHTFLEDYNKRRDKRMESARTETPGSLSGSTLVGTASTLSAGNSMTLQKATLSPRPSWRRNPSVSGDIG